MLNHKGKLCPWSFNKNISDSIKPISNNGRIDQVVILDNVHLGSNSPLAPYSQPQIFTIAKKDESGYSLRDSENNLIIVDYDTMSYVFDATEWMGWSLGRIDRVITSGNKRIQTLQGHVSLLTGILTSQGVRVVTQEQAEELGLSQKS